MVTWTVEGVAKLIPQFIMILGMSPILHVISLTPGQSKSTLFPVWNLNLELNFHLGMHILI